MATLHFKATTKATPEQFTAALTGFVPPLPSFAVEEFDGETVEGSAWDQSAL
jgi:hypothetical protein